MRWERRETYDGDADVPAAVAEALAEEDDDGDEHDDQRGGAQVRGAGAQRDEGGHLEEHHQDGDLEEGDRRRVDRGADLAGRVDVVDVVPVDQVLHAHVEKACRRGRKINWLVIRADWRIGEIKLIKIVMKVAYLPQGAITGQVRL